MTSSVSSERLFQLRKYKPPRLFDHLLSFLNCQIDQPQEMEWHRCTQKKKSLGVCPTGIEWGLTQSQTVFKAEQITALYWYICLSLPFEIKVHV